MSDVMQKPLDLVLKVHKDHLEISIMPIFHSKKLPNTPSLF